MKSKNAFSTSSLRFRRWSRAGYAVFCSLGCSVTIGSLAVSISDKSLQKSVGDSKSTVLTFASDTESSDVSSEFQEPGAILCQVRELSFLEYTTDSAAACSQHPNNYFIHQNG